jgi:hypothetical protein
MAAFRASVSLLLILARDISLSLLTAGGSPVTGEAVAVFVFSRLIRVSLFELLVAAAAAGGLVAVAVAVGGGVPLDLALLIILRMLMPPLMLAEDAGSDDGAGALTVTGVGGVGTGGDFTTGSVAKAPSTTASESPAGGGGASAFKGTWNCCTAAWLPVCGW